MADANPHAITAEQIRAWKLALAMEQPDTSRRRSTTTVGRSMTVVPDFEAILLRIRTETGEDLDLRLNPVIAMAISADLATCCRTAGWLDETGIVTPHPR